MDIPTRTESIDSIADRFRQQYGSLPDWHTVSRDKGILYREDDRFVVPVSGIFNNSQYFIGVPKNAGTFWGEFSRAHEFGHILLGHFNCSEPEEIKEVEANHFARRVVGEDTAVMLFSEFFDLAFRVIQSPRAVYITLFGTPTVYRDYLAEILK